MFGDPKREFFTSKARLNFEVGMYLYGQRDKIIPRGWGKKAAFWVGLGSGQAGITFDARDL